MGGQGRPGRLRRLLGMPRELARMAESIAVIRRAVDDDLPRMFKILEALVEDTPSNRRRLGELRASPDYELAFTDESPLVSVVIPTYTNSELLRERSIPSVLAQTYSNFEIVVVGDCAPAETAQALESFDDPRIVYENLTIRGPYPEDAFSRWNVSGSIPFNAAVQRARGRWIAPFADDDALRPHALEKVLETVQRERFDVCYGVVNCILDDGREFELGEFPPRHGGFTLQGSLYHAGLRFIEHQLEAALFGIPNDWSLVRRMLLAGARFGFVDEVVADYYARRNPLGIYPGGH